MRGAPGAGGPRGNKNALKLGLYTREAIALRSLLRQSRKTDDAFFYSTRK
jgi:hypothetical protein